MPPSSITYNFESLLSTTWMNYREKLYDNTFNACPAWYWFHSNNRKRTEDGGERIVIPLEYGKNSTFKSMSSGYDVIDTTPQDTITSCYWEWKEFAGSTTISNRELAQNQGRSKIINLLETKANNTEMSATEELNKMILAFTAGNGGKDLSPLFYIIQKTPSNSASVGGINQLTYAWWRNQTQQGTTATFAGFIAEMVHLYNLCSKGGSKGKRSKPDMILCDQVYYETYEKAALAKGQIMLTNDTVADLGFGGLKFKGATLMWDEYFPDVNGTTAVTDPDNYSRTYCGSVFVNSEFIEFVVCKGQDFVVGPFIQPENQKAKTSIIYLMGEVCCSNRRKQGMHHTVNASITS